VTLESPLRGRSAEIGAALDALRSARRGDAVVVTLRGEPGIGKTALVRTALEQAHRLGFTTAYTAAHEERSRPRRTCSATSLAGIRTWPASPARGCPSSHCPQRSWSRLSPGCGTTLDRCWWCGRTRSSGGRREEGGQRERAFLTRTQ
jgi:hypothetical protein